LNTGYIRNFMIAFGPISSIFDFLTFFVMIVVFKASVPTADFPPLFQTAWFVESLFTQTLVIFAIRTREVPFFKSKPSKWLVINITAILAIALLIPYTVFGEFFKFVPLPPNFLLILVIFIVVYLVLVEMMKKWFYRRFPVL
jgi:Mg2+-importing ATPase